MSDKFPLRPFQTVHLSLTYRHFAAPTMLADHFPYNIAHALEVAAESYGTACRATDLYRDECTPEGAKKFR